MNEKRVTLLDIAQKAGVDKSTVSLALRLDPRINRKTQEHVAQVAESLGYRPDPHLSHLMGYLRSSRPQRKEEVVAYLRFERSPEQDMDKVPFFGEFHMGVKSELERLGYLVENFHLREYDFKSLRLSQVLFHRGIRGIVVSPPPGITNLDDFEWDRFSSITMGYRLQEPQLCRVVCDQIAIIRMVLDELQDRGYKRPALAYKRGMDSHVNQRWSIALEGCRHLYPSIDIGSIYVGEADQGFLDFWKDSNADCIIGLHYEFARVLTNHGCRIPEDVGFALLDKHDGPEGVTSIDQQPFLLGQSSARQLSGFLDRNEMGIPSQPFTLTTQPVWVEGNTLRKPD